MEKVTGSEGPKRVDLDLLLPESISFATGPIADRAIDITDDLELMFIEMVPGGIYKPKNCLARQSVAIIVPYL